MRLIMLIIFWVHPENTQLRKESSNDKTMLEVLQALAKEGDETQNLFSSDDLQVTLHRGDHAVELKEKRECLEEARNMQQVLRSFKAGDMETYRDSQRIWIDDRNPAVEKVFGFAKPYRDSYWVQAEFEGVIRIVDAKQTKVLIKLTPPNSSGIYHGRTAIMQTKIEA